MKWTVILAKVRSHAFGLGRRKIRMSAVDCQSGDEDDGLSWKWCNECPLLWSKVFWAAIRDLMVMKRTVAAAVNQEKD